VPNPETKYKRSKIILSVTSVAFTVVNICTELLQLPVQSLVGSLGTLDPDDPGHKSRTVPCLV